MSSVETGQMSAVETGQMSAAETGQMSAVETRQMYSVSALLLLGILPQALFFGENDPPGFYKPCC